LFFIFFLLEFKDSGVALRQLAEVERNTIQDMFIVYAIYNLKHKKIYIGQTFDLEKRLNEHNRKLFKGYTSAFDGEWKIIYKEQATTRPEALKREKQLKSFRGRQFIKKYIPE